MKRIVTLEKWHSWGPDDSFSVGDYAVDEIVCDLRNCLPPAWDTRELFQLGEPYSHVEAPETGKFRPTFSTFVRDGKYWRCCGHCFLGETQHRGGW